MVINAGLDKSGVHGMSSQLPPNKFNRKWIVGFGERIGLNQMVLLRLELAYSVDSFSGNQQPWWMDQFDLLLRTVCFSKDRIEGP